MTPALDAAEKRVFSMTGFARGTGRVHDALGWTLTIKSVNHRFLDLHFRLPASTDSLEMRLRRLLKERLVRGHIEMTLTLERATRREAQYDAALLQAYLAAFQAAAKEHDLAGTPDLNVILGLPGVFGNGHGGGPGAEDRAAEAKQLEASVLSGIGEVLAAFQQMRAEEGTALAAELRALMRRMEEHVREVAGAHQLAEREHFERVKDRIMALLGGQVDRERLLQEAAVVAERSDVSEEIARLRMHVAQFTAQLEAGGELGKKLDFLLQEMNREANTLLSKTAGIGGEGTRMTGLGLQMKSDIEKAREQVQNIE